jgi:hypothetical protein
MRDRTQIRKAIQQLIVLLQNISFFSPKYEFVEQRLHIFAVSETWLNQEMSSDLLCIPGFSPMFRRDRNNGRRAGGVAFIYLFQFCI